jgi:hypothetical protein
MRRLDAFTIIELCMVMLLSAIVIGIAFFTLNIFQGSVRSFKTDAGAIADISTLHRLLAKDIWRSDEVVYTEEGFLIQSTKRGMVSYHFLPECIVRLQASRIDTFPFIIEELHGYFLKEEVQVPSQLVDEISFTLFHKEEAHPFYFYKTYAADALIKHETANPR